MNKTAEAQNAIQDILRNVLHASALRQQAEENRKRTDLLTQEQERKETTESLATAHSLAETVGSYTPKLKQYILGMSKKLTGRNIEMPTEKVAAVPPVTETVPAVSPYTSYAPTPTIKSGFLPTQHAGVPEQTRTIKEGIPETTREIPWQTKSQRELGEITARARAEQEAKTLFPTPEKPKYEWVEMPDGSIIQSKEGQAPAGSKPYKSDKE